MAGGRLRKSGAACGFQQKSWRVLEGGGLETQQNMSEPVEHAEDPDSGLADALEPVRNSDGSRTILGAEFWVYHESWDTSL